MVLKLEDKKAIVAEVAKVASTALSAVAADYRGITVGDMNKLRDKARKGGVYLRVVRNTLARRAVEGTEFECLKDKLTGSLILGFSETEPGAAARLFRDFSKGNEKIKVQLLAIGGKAFGADQLNAIATLPTRNEAIAIVMGVMKQPIEKFVRTLAEPQTQFVRVVAAIRDQKQAQA